LPKSTKEEDGGGESGIDRAVRQLKSDVGVRPSLADRAAQAIVDEQIAAMDEYNAIGRPLLNPNIELPLENGGVIRILERQLFGSMTGAEARRILAEEPDIVGAISAGIAAGLVKVMDLWWIPDEANNIITNIAKRTEEQDRELERKRRDANARIRRNMQDPNGPLGSRYAR
jgi:hypothetical protein